MDFARLRKRMVDEQLRARGINDHRVLRVMEEIPRHEFVPGSYLANAYADYPLSIGENQTISQPYIVALMTQCLNLKGGEKILEIGTGSGYQTAILAGLGKEVYTVERIASLGRRAQERLKEMGYENIKIKVADGTLGWEEHCPYDRIIITAAAPEIPSALVKQLMDGGEMLLPLGGSFSQILTRVIRRGADIETRDICSCIFVPLVGKYGWKEKNGS